MTANAPNKSDTCFRCGSENSGLTRVPHPVVSENQQVSVYENDCVISTDIPYLCHWCHTSRVFESVRTVPHSDPDNTGHVPQCVDDCSGTNTDDYRVTTPIN